MFSKKLRTVTELFAVINGHGEVVCTPGGSSTNSRAMVYPKESTAKAQIARFKLKDCGVIRVYRVQSGMIETSHARVL